MVLSKYFNHWNIVLMFCIVQAAACCSIVRWVNGSSIFCSVWWPHNSLSSTMFYLIYRFELNYGTHTSRLLFDYLLWLLTTSHQTILVLLDASKSDDKQHLPLHHNLLFFCSLPCQPIQRPLNQCTVGCSWWW